jgi:hypothetical protein
MSPGRGGGVGDFSHLSDVCLSDFDFEMDPGLDPSQNLSFLPGAFCDAFLAEISASHFRPEVVTSGWQLIT